jgi:methenyltetrahydrofolate cyclohydrolase
LFAKMTITEFLEKTAANTPVPGGGSVAALNAAVAASLVEMVANLTIGKKGFEEKKADMQDLASRAAGYRQKLAGDIDRDSDAFDGVMAAFRLPKQTEEEKEKRRRAVQAALETAARVPLEVAEDALKIMELAQKAVAEGNPNAVTDGTVAAMTARTAVLSALYNVKINLTSMTDRSFVEKTSQRVQEIESVVETKEKEIRQLVDL